MIKTVNKFLTSTLIFILLISITQVKAEELIKDVNSNNPYYNAVNKTVNDFKIISLSNDQLFNGAKNIDRYTYSIIIYDTVEFMNVMMKEINQETILSTNMSNNDYAKLKDITDLKKTNEYYTKVATLLKLGLIRPFSDNNFKGEKMVDYLGFAIGIGRLMKIIYDKAPIAVKKKWSKDQLIGLESIKGVPKESSIYPVLKLSIEQDLIIYNEGNNLTKPITRYEVAESLVKLLNKLEDLRKYLIYSKTG